MFKKILSSAIIVCFFINTLGPIPKAHADIIGLPTPGTMVNLTPAYVPVIVKGLRVHPENPVLFDFIVDTGNSGLTINDPKLKTESERIIKYFLASLTIPEDNLWVNLSPYEKNRIIPDQLGQTEMGRDMLAEDYILKQLTASLIYPEKDLGREFWNKVYAKAQEQYGTSQIPVNTFNKVWIVADKAKVYVHDNTAFVVTSHLKVMLEEDYLSLAKHDGVQQNMSFPNASVGNLEKTHSIASSIVRQIVLPQLEQEINTGKNFANLRQIFHSMILAAWYKKNLKEALLNQVYSNKSKINGVDVSDKTIKEKIYQQYLKAYKKGVFNYIKDDIQNGQSIPRKYFSGGEEFGSVVEGVQATNDLSEYDVAHSDQLPTVGEVLDERVEAADSNAAMANEPVAEYEIPDIQKNKDLKPIIKEFLGNWLIVSPKLEVIENEESSESKIISSISAMLPRIDRSRIQELITFSIGDPKLDNFLSTPRSIAETAAKYKIRLGELITLAEGYLKVMPEGQKPLMQKTIDQLKPNIDVLDNLVKVCQAFPDDQQDMRTYEILNDALLKGIESPLEYRPGMGLITYGELSKEHPSTEESQRILSEILQALTNIKVLVEAKYSLDSVFRTISVHDKAMSLSATTGSKSLEEETEMFQQALLELANNPLSIRNNLNIVNRALQQGMSIVNAEASEYENPSETEPFKTRMAVLKEQEIVLARVVRYYYSVVVNKIHPSEGTKQGLIKAINESFPDGSPYVEGEINHKIRESLIYVLEVLSSDLVKSVVEAAKITDSINNLFSGRVSVNGAFAARSLINFAKGSITEIPADQQGILIERGLLNPDGITFPEFVKSVAVKYDAAMSNEQQKPISWKLVLGSAGASIAVLAAIWGGIGNLAFSGSVNEETLRVREAEAHVYYPSTIEFELHDNDTLETVSARTGVSVETLRQFNFTGTSPSDDFWGKRGIPMVVPGVAKLAISFNSHGESREDLAGYILGDSKDSLRILQTPNTQNSSKYLGIYDGEYDGGVVSVTVVGNPQELNAIQGRLRTFPKDKEGNYTFSIDRAMKGEEKSLEYPVLISNEKKRNSEAWLTGILLSVIAVGLFTLDYFGAKHNGYVQTYISETQAILRQHGYNSSYVYEMQDGDTFAKIAARTGADEGVLRRYNHLDPTIMSSGLRGKPMLIPGETKIGVRFLNHGETREDLARILLGDSRYSKRILMESEEELSLFSNYSNNTQEIVIVGDPETIARVQAVLKTIKLETPSEGESPYYDLSKAGKGQASSASEDKGNRAMTVQDVLEIVNRYINRDVTKILLVSLDGDPISADLLKEKLEDGVDYIVHIKEEDGFVRIQIITKKRVSKVLVLAGSGQSTKVDMASSAFKPVEVEGGIDFNSRNMQMDEDGQKISMRFDPAMVAQFRRGDFSGVRPVILSITPIVNMMPLLGAKG